VAPGEQSPGATRPEGSSGNREQQSTILSARSFVWQWNVPFRSNGRSANAARKSNHPRPPYWLPAQYGSNDTLVHLALQGRSGVAGGNAIAVRVL
jgi:hypothetical protein